MVAEAAEPPSERSMAGLPNCLRGDSVMNPRTFVGAVAGSLLTLPLATEAQQAEKVSRVGVIGARPPPDAYLSAFRQGMLEKGYIEGRNIVIEYRYVQGVVDRFPALVDELIRLKVDVL